MGNRELSGSDAKLSLKTVQLHSLGSAWRPLFYSCDSPVTAWSPRSFAGMSRKPKMGSGRLLPSTEHPFNERSKSQRDPLPLLQQADRQSAGFSGKGLGRRDHRSGPGGSIAPVLRPDATRAGIDLE